MLLPSFTFYAATVVLFSLETKAGVFDLSNLKWTITNRNGTINVPASGPPSQAHLDLLKAGIIADPLLEINDFTQRWIANENWTYSADISPFLDSPSFREANDTLLVFYGIDTIANITLAGHPVAWVNNQFTQYIFNVSEILRSTRDAKLVVAFESAWTYGLNVTGRADAEFFPVQTTDNFEYPGVRQWIRKIASDFGWDWGPAFVPSGIHKSAYFVTLGSTVGTKASPEAQELAPEVNDSSDIAFIEETSIDIYKAGQSFSVPPNEIADWIVNVTLALRSSMAFDTITMSLQFPELGVSNKFLFQEGYSQRSVNAPVWVSSLWRIPDTIPQRWYPHNLGVPKLYNLSTTLEFHSSSSISTISFVTRTGFRTIQLVQSPYSQQDVQTRGIIPGDQWHFNINGRPFYVLGTNIIPFDPFYARTTTEQLRVWGGGTYQPSDSSTAGGVYDFYSVCDELGILAWSELIFSDSLYPINDFLLESIEPEVRQNVRRINRHPSNAQWAGGNEIEGIVTQAAHALTNGTHYLNEFVTLFQDFLQRIVSSETRSVPYTDCSTTNGVLSLDPYVLRFDNETPGEIYGNSERYNYDASQAFNYSTFPVSRFVNEFGFHSMPSFYSWEEVLTSPADFSFNSSVVMSRDHHPPAGNLAFPNPNAPQGQAQMTQAVEAWLPIPSTLESNQTFAQWCWSTQVFQNLAMVSQVAWYRHGAGKGENNLGALVWQLNDIWQGPFTVPALNNSLILQHSGMESLLPTGYDARDVWMLVNLTAQTDGRTVTNEQYFTPTSLAIARLHDPLISVERSDDLTFTLSAKGGVSPWTWIDHPSGTVGLFVDTSTGLPTNGFYLIPGIDHFLRFEINEALSRVRKPAATEFVVRSLWNNTHT
ncbi:glycoside hydrolase family 2 protein [Hypholoma sublateritium FD-334 SS-4]|uniref:Beta-mannosidase A n=1 Tax=Hypholoma sublateritium (strain FD-334 SS-4) TaxID=945553 RepID=A0A0D2KXD4_HYPSF|nr:glycoside hydrolase family 2 protein [Hypholoma sublateritium FD-334 SS-4]